MSIFSQLARRYKKQCETNENHSDPELTTRYYRTNTAQMLQTIEELFRADHNVNILSISKEHGEIAAEIKKDKSVFAIVTVVTVKPFETAVDINISTEQSSPAGVHPILKREVLSIYEKLNKRHDFLGSARNADK
ncbi:MULTISPECIES: hypothetical protein [unclassified Cytobacillus]|uniref:hypothetical protein n=1 Tax=unclassified Cytobacillus TaxID=2675268 RepID=UPI00135B34F0|nr:hypothetical protein [Cytobacillus sp. AMY 15.2]KAF0819463.1 hypothetical protein KIS4809_1828 [Bacillus sp. ZZV12-4809]MCM3092042.1 hypothetical protein [Cytobacillus sp. AMY 15.2]